MRSTITTALELLGLISITVGAAMLATPAGLIVGGAVAVGLGYRHGGDE